MKKLIHFTFLSLAFVLSGAAFGQSNLPPCRGSDVSKWSNCTGELTTKDFIYKGGFLNGKKHGSGQMNALHPDFKGDKYVGEYKDDKINGQGTYTHANGDKYVGEYKDDKINGQVIFAFLYNKQYTSRLLKRVMFSMTQKKSMKRHDRN